MKYDVRGSMFEWSTESHAEIKCGMDFTMYPFDTQICPFVIIADKNLTYQEIISKFQKMSLLLTRYDFFWQEFSTNAVLADRTRNEKFDIYLDNTIEGKFYNQDTNETYSQTGFNLIFERSATKYFVNVFIPTSLLTIASFIGFLIPVEVVPGRMTLLVTIFLMLVNVSNTGQNRGPIVRQC